MSFKCKKCDMKFEEERRLLIHMKTHMNKKSKKLKKGMPDFEKPDFSQVNL